MDFWNVLGSFGGKKRKRNDDIRPNLTAAPLITSVFPKPPVKVNESLYKVDSPLSTPTMEVLFFHGLQFGDPTESHFWTTWESRDRSCIWPEKWLGEDFPGAKIMFVSYDGDVTRRTSNSSDLYIIIENLITDLLQDGIGQMQNCPLIMVGHCFGGVVIKQLCLGIQKKISLTKSDTERVKLRNFLDNIKGIFYYDTPHHGISGLDKATAVKNDPFLTFFQILSRDTGRLNFEFSHLRGSYKWQIDGLGASLPTKLSKFRVILMVPESSGREGADHFNVVENVDHCAICRPRSTNSRSFYALKDFMTKTSILENAQLLAGKVATHDLLERSGGQTLAHCLLPFIPDHKYVPILDSVLEIQEALEEAEGQRIITLHEGPGLGKSSAVKYLALRYQEERKQWLTGTQPTTPTFPDGVYYLYCGKEAQGRVKHLLLELMECLGFGAAELSVAAAQGESFQLASVQRRIQSRSVQPPLLIILDDLWERDVMQKLLIRAERVKYLITSQNKAIWDGAKKIRMKRPTTSEARQIMATYTEGLPTKGNFPNSIQHVTDNIIRKVECHPLSLANIGVSINSSRATDASLWKAIDDNIHVPLDKNDVQGSPIVYDSPYSFTVSASMILMVDSLRPEARRLLFLIALLGGEDYLPESLVRYFQNFLRTAETKDPLSEYYTEEKYLEDRSLITVFRRGWNEHKARLGAHSLRMHYIREKKTLAVREIASQMLLSSDQGPELIKRGDTEETLVTILSAMYFKPPFTDVVVKSLETHFGIMNDGVIRRNINNDIDALQVVKRMKSYVSGIVPFIDVIDRGPDWKQKAHAYTKRIIIKLACQGKLDDCSMAGLLQIPETTSKACQVLEKIIFLVTGTKTFSSAHPETMQALLALVHDNATSTKREVAAISPLLRILDYESEDTILRVGTNLAEVLAMDSNPIFECCLMDRISTNCGNYNGFQPRKAEAIICKFTKLLEVILELLLSGKDDKVRVSAGEALQNFCLWNFLALKIASIPEALAKLFNLFVSEDTFYSVAGVILASLSRALQNKCEFRAVKGGLEGLGDILAKVKGNWQAAHKQEDRKKLEKQAVIAAEILGELAVDELKEAILSLPKVEEGLLFVQAIEMTRSAPDLYCVFSEGENNLDDSLYYPIMSTRALVLLHFNTLNPRSRDVPHVGELEVVDEGFLSKVFVPDKFDVGFSTFLRQLEVLDEGISKKICMVDAYFRAYWTQVHAYLEMGDYRAAFESLNLAQHHCNVIPIAEFPFIRGYVLLSNPWIESSSTWVDFISALSDTRVYLLALLKHHVGALAAANTNVGKFSKSIDHIVERGIVKKTCGDLQGALDDLNLANTMLDSIPDKTLDSLHKYDIWKHRGHVKHLMEDEVGAREDAEAAQQLELDLENGRTREQRLDCLSLRLLRNETIAYLGYRFYW